MFTLIDFWADWCIPCKRMMPIFTQVIPDYAEHLEFVKIDSDDPVNESKLREYDIRSIPTLILLDSDGNIKAAKTGAMPEQALRDWLDSELGIISGQI